MEHFFKDIEGWFSFPNLYAYAVSQFDNAKFVEIGTWQGQSASFMAVEIANSRKNIDFFCVDTWSGSEEHQTDEIVIKDALYDKFLSNIEPVKNYITPLRMSSERASQHFKDGSLDFIFIDAAHDYENVKKDIEAWYPKLKVGGVIAGHDFHPDWPGVMKAVEEWAKSNSKKILTAELCWITEKTRFN